MEQIEVSLAGVLAARETRAAKQQELISHFARPVVSYTLNIAGPVKNGPAFRRCFDEGLARLHRELRYAGLPILHEENTDAPTGCEALIAVDGDAMRIKALCAGIEDEDEMGRLFDMDVIDPQRGKLDRSELGLEPRRCIICGAIGSGCASRRLHPVSALQAKTGLLIRSFFQSSDAEFIASQAVRALLYEVCTTPKPGLVDRANSGSHRDMDIFTFMTSTAALIPYFQSAAAIGQDNAALSPEDCFALLRREGRKAEEAMFAATNGVNTHKGAIFSLGTVCCAMGRLWTVAGLCRDVHGILAECSLLVRRQVIEDMAHMTGSTAGQRIYRQYGLSGIRGEIKNALPSVEKLALPALRASLAAGKSLEQSGVDAFLALLGGVADTNIVSRGGTGALEWANTRARELVSRAAGVDEVSRFDAEMIERNLSPGGCADLLAITYFLYFCCGENKAPFQTG